VFPGPRGATSSPLLPETRAPPPHPPPVTEPTRTRHDRCPSTASSRRETRGIPRRGGTPRPGTNTPTDSSSTASTRLTHSVFRGSTSTSPSLTRAQPCRSFRRGAAPRHHRIRRGPWADYCRGLGSNATPSPRGMSRHAKPDSETPPNALGRPTEPTVTEGPPLRAHRVGPPVRRPVIPKRPWYTEKTMNEILHGQSCGRWFPVEDRLKRACS